MERSPYYLAMRAYHRARVLRARIRKPPPWHGVRILGYHRIDDVEEVLCVRPERFRAQMEAVLESDATPIRLDRALDLLGDRVEGRYVCVTFDDGYRDNAENALPVLRELGIPATIFVVSAIASGRETFHWYDDPPPALGWSELDAIVREGLVDVQSHSRTHPWLPRVDDDRAREEIVASKAELEAHLPYAVTSLCYPAGLYGEREVRLVREAGYRAGVTTDPGVNRGGDALWSLRRTTVYWEDTDADFAVKLAGGLDAPPALRGLLYRHRAGG